MESVWEQYQLDHPDQHVIQVADPRPSPPEWILATTSRPPPVRIIPAQSSISTGNAIAQLQGMLMEAGEDVREAFYILISLLVTMVLTAVFFSLKK